MTPELRESFRKARYELHLPQGIVSLAVDQHCAKLGEWLCAHECNCGAWMTAYNPGSRVRANSSNTIAQLLLESRLKSARYRLVEGVAMDPGGHWPPEPSVFAAGIVLDEARSLAREFGQLAFLWCRDDAIPRLVETAQTER